MIETDILQGDIRYRPQDHSYLYVPTGRYLTSVSEVIRVVYGTKSWDGVKPEIVERAAYRGSTVDHFMSEYVHHGSLVLPIPETDMERDIHHRTEVAHRIWEDQFGGLPAEAQKIVCDLNHGIAGTVDFWVDTGRIIVDLKSTYNVERAWILQLGGYARMADIQPERCGIIHISPKVYKDGGRWIEYDVARCMQYWDKALSWYLDSKAMKA